jgi:hypothetical protein
MDHVSWSLEQFSKDHFLEVGLIQNQETMALQNLITVGLLDCIICEDPTWIEFIEIVFGWGPSHIWLHTTLEGPWPHHMILEVSWVAFGHFLLGSHDFMVTTLGLCVKWPLGCKARASKCVGKLIHWGGENMWSSLDVSSLFHPKWHQECQTSLVG